jgi:hypothetical protein
MAYSLRLPPALDQAARARAIQLGVSFNSLMCFALDQYMRGGVSGRPAGVLVDELDSVNPKRVSHGGMPLSVKTPQGLAAKLGHRPTQSDIALNGLNVAVAPSVPVVVSAPLPLTGNPSKAERRAFTAQARAFKKQG